MKLCINTIFLIFQSVFSLSLMAMENNNPIMKKMPDLVPWQDAPKASKKLEGSVDFFLKKRSIMSLQDLCLFGVAQHIKNRINEKDLDFDQNNVQEIVDALISHNLDEQKFLSLLAEEIEPEFKVNTVIKSNELEHIAFCGSEPLASYSRELLGSLCGSSDGKHIVKCLSNSAFLYNNEKKEKLYLYRGEGGWGSYFSKVVFSPDNKHIALLCIDGTISIITINHELLPDEWAIQHFSSGCKEVALAFYLGDSHFIFCDNNGHAKMYVLDETTNEYTIQKFNISGALSDIIVNQNSSVMGFQHTKSDDVSIVNWNECSIKKLELGTLLGITLSKKLIAAKDKKIKIYDLDGFELNSFNAFFDTYETTIHRNLNILPNIPAYLIRKIELKKEMRNVSVEISCPSCSRPEYESREESVTSQIHHLYVPQLWSLDALYPQLGLMAQKREINNKAIMHLEKNY